MVSFMTLPKYKLTLGTTELTAAFLSFKVTRLENGWDSATFVLPDTSYYPGIVTNGTAIQFDVKDASEDSYTTVFKGIVRFLTPDISNQGRILMLSCLGSGFPLSEMLVGNEYGAQSSSPSNNTIRGISKDIIANYVNKILGSAAASGYSINADDARIENLAGSIPYISWPYKPADKCLNDLIDLHTAISAGSSFAGPQWIVDTSGQLRIKRVSSDQTGWPHYYGGSQEAATLTYGKDLLHVNLEKMAPECNYVVYWGTWRRPSNGDSLTNPANDIEAQTLWSPINDHGTVSTVTMDTTNNQVGTSCVRLTTPSNFVNCEMRYHTSSPCDFSSFQSAFNIPNLNFYMMTHGYGSTDGPMLRLIESVTTDGFGSVIPDKYFQINMGTSNNLMENASALINANDIPTKVSIPVGPFCSLANNSKVRWINHDGASWANINYISILGFAPAVNTYCVIDGLHFGDASICRVAYNSTNIVNHGTKMRLIVDDIGKDDSLKASDDSGLMAKMAYAELLRGQTTALVGTVETSMIKDALPGQCFSIQGLTYRITKIVHSGDSQHGFLSTFSITDDLTNGRSRPRYEDLNKQFASQRPEWQDRAASSQKARSVDWAIARLSKDYPS